MTCRGSGRCARCPPSVELLEALLPPGGSSRFMACQSYCGLPCSHPSRRNSQGNARNPGRAIARGRRAAGSPRHRRCPARGRSASVAHDADAFSSHSRRRCHRRRKRYCMNFSAMSSASAFEARRERQACASINSPASPSSPCCRSSASPPRTAQSSSQ